MAISLRLGKTEKDTPARRPRAGPAHPPGAGTAPRLPTANRMAAAGRAPAVLHDGDDAFMGRQRKGSGERNGSAANLGFDAKLRLAAAKLHNNMDAAEYKHVVLGLSFLKYISDSFEEHRAENVFWVPKEARWSHLQAYAKQPAIGKIVDMAMGAIEYGNPRLRGVLPKDYARPGLDKHRLGGLINLIATIGLGQQDGRAKDIGSFNVILPSKPIAAAFTKLIQPMIERITANLHQSRTLATLRDTPLPKLLSGELSVKTASTLTEARA